MTTKTNSGTVSVSRELLGKLVDADFSVKGQGMPNHFLPMIEELRATLAQPADQQGEPVPVAWMRFDDDQRAIFTRSKRSKNSEALYTRPTAYRQAQPATAKVDEPFGKYGDTMRPFVELMRKELEANSHKGDREGWLRMDSRTALLELHYHVAKLHYSIAQDDKLRSVEFCADVANCCMMLLDVCGLLIVADDKACDA